GNGARRDREPVRSSVVGRPRDRIRRRPAVLRARRGRLGADEAGGPRFRGREAGGLHGPAAGRAGDLQRPVLRRPVRRHRRPRLHRLAPIAEGQHRLRPVPRRGSAARSLLPSVTLAPMAGDLLPGENLILKLHQHWIFVAKSLMIPVALLILVVLADVSFLKSNAGAIQIATLAVVAIALLWLIVVWIRWRSVAYTLTDQRIKI